MAELGFSTHCTERIAANAAAPSLPGVNVALVRDVGRCGLRHHAARSDAEVGEGVFFQPGAASRRGHRASRTPLTLQRHRRLRYAGIRRWAASWLDIALFMRGDVFPRHGRRIHDPHVLFSAPRGGQQGHLGVRLADLEEANRLLSAGVHHRLVSDPRGMAAIEIRHLSSRGHRGADGPPRRHLPGAAP